MNPDLAEQSGQLAVRVSAKRHADLVLDAGRWENVEEDGVISRVIHAPQETMFHQLLAYLDAQPQPGYHEFPSAREEARAMAAVCLRWGTYFAHLTDHDLPPNPKGKQTEISQISDGEMKRVNIEMSAALAEWIDMRRQYGERYFRLVSWALKLLPLTPSHLRGYPDKAIFFSLCHAEQHMAEDAREAALAEWGEEGRQRVQQINQYPTRVFANALTNYGWRNQPDTENLHAGAHDAAALDPTMCRIRAQDERSILRTVWMSMLEGVSALNQFLFHDGRPWEQQVAIYNTADLLLVTPHDWSLTEETCDIWYPMYEIERDTAGK
jgi:hypothetical protein